MSSLNLDNNIPIPPSQSHSSNDCHSYHQNLPPTYFDENGKCNITKFAQHKARAIVRLVHSIQLKEELYNKNIVDQLSSAGDDNEDERGEMDMDMDMDMEDELMDYDEDEDEDDEFSNYFMDDQVSLVSSNIDIRMVFNF